MRTLKRQMQPIQAQGDGYDKATHHLRFHVLEGHLDRTHTTKTA